MKVICNADITIELGRQGLRCAAWEEEEYKFGIDFSIKNYVQKRTHET